MKKLFTLLAAVLFTATTYAQIGINNENPDASAALDITSTTGGLLIPRMTGAERDAISSPATGLMIFQTDGVPGIYNYNSGSWSQINEGSGGSSNPTYNNEISYQAAAGGADYEVHITSTGNLYQGLSWTRSTTTLSITSTAHGLSSGDYIVIRNMSEDYSYLAISNVTTNAFDVTVADSGGGSGTEGAYIPAVEATVTQTSGDVTAIVLDAPTVGNIRVNTIQLYANEQVSSMTIDVPSSLSNGNGFTDKQQIIPVVGAAINADGTGTSGGLTAAFQYNLGTNLNRINVTGIDNGTPVILSIKL